MEKELKNIPETITSIVYFVVGLVCIIFSKQIMPAIPYIFGTLQLLVGLLTVIRYFVKRKYTDNDSGLLVWAGINVAVGFVFITNHQLGLDVFALFWGIHAIINAIECFHKILYSIYAKQKWNMFLIEGIVELILGVMLLIEFSEGLATHILILGFYLALIGLFGVFGVNIKKNDRKSLRGFKYKNTDEKTSNLAKEETTIDAENLDANPSLSETQKDADGK